MAKKRLTPEEIRLNLAAEIRALDGAFDHSEISRAINRYIDTMVERALVDYDVAIEDKKRQLELGELADKFFQRIKLND